MHVESVMHADYNKFPWIVKCHVHGSQTAKECSHIVCGQENRILEDKLFQVERHSIGFLVQAHLKQSELISIKDKTTSLFSIIVFFLLIDFGATCYAQLSVPPSFPNSKQFYVIYKNFLYLILKEKLRYYSSDFYTQLVCYLLSVVLKYCFVLHSLCEYWVFCMQSYKIIHRINISGKRTLNIIIKNSEAT